jgi:hypothetical protein
MEVEYQSILQPYGMWTVQLSRWVLIYHPIQRHFSEDRNLEYSFHVWCLTYQI